MQLILDFVMQYPGFALEARQAIRINGIIGLIGDSGSGKTTLLRIIAGLEKAAKGSVLFNDLAWQDENTFIRPDKRRVSLVFQDLRLFEHLSVDGNLQYAANRNRGNIQFLDVVETLDLWPLLSRFPRTLSGGEKQRVAIARSLLSQPDLLLMDEPLSGLDKGRREEILPYIKKLPDSFALPVIYVSHNFDEITMLCENIMSIRQGKLLAVSQTPEANSCLDKNTYLEASVMHQDDLLQQTLVNIGNETFFIHTPLEQGKEKLTLCFNAEDIILSLNQPASLSTSNIKTVKIVEIREHAPGPQVIVILDLKGMELLAAIPRSSLEKLGLMEGQYVHAIINRIQAVQ